MLCKKASYSWVCAANTHTNKTFRTVSFKRGKSIQPYEVPHFGKVCNILFAEIEKLLFFRQLISRKKITLTSQILTFYIWQQGK